MSTASPGTSPLTNASSTTKTALSLARIWEPVAEEMTLLQALYHDSVIAAAERNHIHELLLSDDCECIPKELRVEIVERVSRHLLATEGKWIRPGLVMLSAHAFGARGLPVRQVGVAVELIHLATLTHDDIIDEATTRRSEVSVCYGWGNSIAVLVGDFLFSKAFRLLLESGSIPSQNALAIATGQMCLGEIKQLRHVHQFLTSEEQYLQTIEYKTAALMAAATASGGELAGCDPDTVEAWSRIGHDIGMAFQVADDILDYTSSSKMMGKEHGGDLRNGKLTLPLIHLLERQPDILPLIQEQYDSPETIDKLRSAMEAEGSFEYSNALGRRYIERAQKDLLLLHERATHPEGVDSLLQLTELILTRCS